MYGIWYSLIRMLSNHQGVIYWTYFWLCLETTFEKVALIDLLTTIWDPDLDAHILIPDLKTIACYQNFSDCKVKKHKQ